jgi:hypothetical protein
LKEKLAVESDGAVRFFPEGFKNKEGEPPPFIIQKSEAYFTRRRIWRRFDFVCELAPNGLFM